MEAFTFALAARVAANPSKFIPADIKSVAAERSKGLSPEATKFVDVVAEDLMKNQSALVVAGPRQSPLIHAVVALDQRSAPRALEQHRPVLPHLWPRRPG